MKIFAIVLNYKQVLDTIECIKSLSNSHLPKNVMLKTIVVDNNSQDGSVSKLRKLKGVKVIENTKNLGYAGGNNIGIKYALNQEADCVLILNSDVTLRDDAISALLEKSTNAAIISPKIYFAAGFEFHKSRYNKVDQGKVIWYAGGKIDWNNIIGTHIGVDEIDTGQYDNAKEIDFATGACLLIKKEVFANVGFFDEKYFLYLEDIDFCMRAKKNKFKIYYQPKAILWHKNAASSGGSGSNLQDYYITRNRLLFAFKFANLNTKLAVLKQVVAQSLKSKIKRKALKDFITLNFGKGSYKINT